MADSNITKNALKDAMIELMQKKPFDKISVTDICEKCGMNRKSFYYHFKDKYDLVNWIFYIGFMNNINLADYDLETHTPDESWMLIEKLAAYFYSERKFYKKALLIEGQNSFKDYYHEVIYPVIKYAVSDLIGEDEYQDFFIDTMCDLLISALVKWLTGPVTVEPHEMVTSYRTMLLKLAKKLTELFPEG